MTEKALQSKILKHLKATGAYIVKTVVSNRNGVPDIIGCYQGQYFAVEVKAPGNKATALQCYNLEKIKEAGGQTIVTSSFNEFIKFFEEDVMGTAVGCSNTTKYKLSQLKKKYGVNVTKILEMAVDNLPEEAIEKVSKLHKPT